MFPPLIDSSMPVTYRIDQANGIIRTSCIGPVTLEEVVDHFRILERDPDCPGYIDVLLDLSEQTSIPKKENLHDVTSAIGVVRDRIQFGAIAVVACSDALFGMLRMFEVFARQYFRESYVFRSKGEAEEWLASRERPATSTADAPHFE